MIEAGAFTVSRSGRQHDGHRSAHRARANACRLGFSPTRPAIWFRRSATPSLVQLVMRVALAVPFWKSGILKWSGFLKLSDTAVTLFTDEFMLHLPGGPYHYPVPAVMAFLSGCGEIAVSGAAGAWLRHPLRRARAVVHDMHRRAHRAGRLADSHHLGGDGARHHGMGSGTNFGRLPGASVLLADIGTHWGPPVILPLGRDTVDATGPSKVER